MRVARIALAAAFASVCDAKGGAVASGDFRVQPPDPPEAQIWAFSYKDPPLSGTGTVSLFGGTTMFGDLTMGALPGQQTATVSGAGSIWNMNSLHVGSNGHSELTIQSGGEVSV